MTSLVPSAHQIEDVLESAVILSWNELLSGSDPSMIHVEYATVPEPCLQYLKIWRSTRRTKWDLVCEYWIAAGGPGTPKMGLTFGRGYHSPSLIKILGSILQHQGGIPDALSGETKINLIVVGLPTPQERLTATRCMSEAYEQRGLSFATMRDSGLNREIN